MPTPICDFRTMRHPARYVCFREGTGTTPPLVILFSSGLQVRRWLADDACFGSVADCTVHDGFGRIVAHISGGKAEFRI